MGGLAESLCERDHRLTSFLLKRFLYITQSFDFREGC